MGWKNHRGRYNRSRERASASLINAGDNPVTIVPALPLPAEIRQTSHLAQMDSATARVRRAYYRSHLRQD